jgi:DNA-binding NarL/FixJ family response regulator/signal transduction histidine kinase
MTTRPRPPDTVRPVERGWLDRLRRVDPRIWDALLALGLVVLGVVVFALRQPRANEPPAAAGYALIVVAAGSLVWRRRFPLIVLSVVAGAASIASLLGYWPEFVLLLWIAVYSASANIERDRLARVLVPVAVLTSVAISLGERWDRGLNWVEVLSDLVVTFGVPLVLGRMTFNRRRRIVRDRELATREAVAAERAAIARELHDVVAHHMSVMVVQAGAARAVGESDPAAASDALREIEASGRTGLAEMRRLLGILKAEGDDGRTPQPGLADLGELLDSMAATGLAVEVVVEGSPRPLPPGVDLSAYRIVQEALTNALRHAGGASAHMVVRYEPGALELEIADDGPGRPDGPPTGGHGLIGMRERAQLFGGEFDAGLRPGGGFLVRAAAVRGTRMSEAAIRVLIADDQALMRTGFGMILDAQDDIEVVGEAIDGADAIRQFEKLEPDVVVMDVRMPTLDGIEATRRLAALERPARVLILTTFDLDDYVYEALRAGASGFLLKDRPPEELVAAVRVIAAGEALLAPSVTRRLIEEFARRAPAAKPIELDQLTEREREVLVLMARGLSNAEIARALFVAESTVKTHVGRVLHKLGLRDRAQAVVLAYESGLVQPGD